MDKLKKNHYVYLLQSKVSEMQYIGVRSCAGLISEDKYMGSSTVMSRQDKANCNKIILKRFSNRKEASEYEIFLHDKFNVSVNPIFWNKATATITAFNFDNTGKIISEEHRLKISKPVVIKSPDGIIKTYFGEIAASQIIGCGHCYISQIKNKCEQKGLTEYKFKQSKAKGYTYLHTETLIARTDKIIDKKFNTNIKMKIITFNAKLKAKLKISKQNLNNKSKPYIIKFPDGNLHYYDNQMLASKAIGCNISALSFLTKKCKDNDLTEWTFSRHSKAVGHTYMHTLTTQARVEARANKKIELNKLKEQYKNDTK